MDLNNLGTTDLSLRLEIEGPIGPMGPEKIAVSTAPFLLNAGSGWTNAFFPTGLDSLTASLGTVAGALANAEVLRILHNPAASQSTAAPAVAASLGVDNITAVPEPASWPLALAGFAMIAVARQLRRLSRR
jgi:hypothetical protein